jgi:hypothetical protein
MNDGDLLDPLIKILWKKRRRMLGFLARMDRWMEGWIDE